MRLVADASALVAELLRTRGRALLLHPDIDWLVTEQVASEVHHEIVRRAAALMRRQGRNPDEGGALARRALDLFTSAVAIVPEPTYAPLGEIARRRLIDERDWSSVALAMVVGTGIWADDRDFCGIGLPTWQTRVLLAEFGLTG